MTKILHLFYIALLMANTSPVLAESYSDYPIQGVAFNDVTINDNFWAPRILQNQEVTIPIALQQCYSTGRVTNFEKAAAILKGQNIGWFGTEYTFDDTDIYKILEGMAYSYKMNPTEELRTEMDKLITIVAAAQEPDGYLYTARTAGQPGNLHSWVGPYRWQYDPIQSHELYCSGHLIEAAVAHYQATGQTSLLDVAKKNADLLVKQFLQGGLKYEPGHQIVEMALVKLYRATGDDNYLKLAKYFLDIRGIGGPESQRYEYNQSQMPPKQQTEAVGHAVRATYMYSGMADVAAIMGDKDYLSASDHIWENMVGKKYYITGGIGALHSGEAFGANYELPNASAYNETCAAIANVYWNWRMFLLHGDSKYYDVLERTLYNGVLSGISLSGDLFFYPNPLANSGGYARSEWFGCACCPSNLCRFMASVPGYAYAHKSDSVYVNLFIQGSAQIPMNNDYVILSQENDYPWQGDMSIRLDRMPQAAPSMTLLVRVPGWAKNQPVPSDLYAYVNTDDAQMAFSQLDIKVNGQSVDYSMDKGYASITREWKAGDKVTFHLPMDVHHVVANQHVAEDQGRVALERGPIVYCLEGDDNDGSVADCVVADDATITAQTDETTFKGNPMVTLDIAGGKAIYTNNALGTEAKPLKAIPYYAWANRDLGEMEVWIARTPQKAKVDYRTVAHTDTLYYHLTEDPGTAAGVYPSKTLTLDKAKIANSLGVTQAELASLFDNEITFAAIEPSDAINANSTANAPGHWFARDGHVVSWVSSPNLVTNTSELPLFFSEFNKSNYTLTIGQYPQQCKRGDVFHFRQALTRIPSDANSMPRRVVIDVKLGIGVDTGIHGVNDNKVLSPNASYDLRGIRVTHPSQVSKGSILIHNGKKRIQR